VNDRVEKLKAMQQQLAVMVADLSATDLNGGNVNLQVDHEFGVLQKRMDQVVAAVYDNTVHLEQIMRELRAISSEHAAEIRKWEKRCKKLGKARSGTTN
jgi:hypothetical protein